MENFKRERDSQNRFDAMKTREKYNFFNPSELSHVDRNYQNYIKAKSKSQRRAKALMNPWQEPIRKESKKFVDTDREAEIDNILTKIKSEAHTQSGTNMYNSPRKERNTVR